MVKLTEVEDESFSEKPATVGEEVLLADENDEDYTDTDSELSDGSDLDNSNSSETISERILALRDIIPPKTRARIFSATSSIYNATSSALSFGGKSLWVVSTSLMLVGIPYALAVGQEQEIMEREREETMLREGSSAMLQSDGDAKAAL